jgi:hypothetical protein
MLTERFLTTLTRTTVTRILIAALVCTWALVSYAQFDDSPFDLEHPAVGYSTRPANTVVDALNDRLQSGALSLPFDARTGFLKPVLSALNVGTDSQIAVFSKTSLQSNLIHSRNPRVIYFNDSVVVAWVPGGFIEIAAHDATQGAVFYRLLQTPIGPPVILRDNRCVSCHNAYATLGVPGFLAKSIPSARDGSGLPWLGNYLTDHRSPLTERWAGWFVTGNAGPSRHLGNAPVTDRNIDDVRVEDANLNLTDLSSRFDTSSYLSPLSDVVALLVFNHQLRMMNLLTRIGWEARMLAHDGRSEAAVVAGIRNSAVETVDYLLFVDEAPLAGVRGSSGFADSFSARGPRDSKGRSLRDLDLKQRLFKYPCSYMIYSQAFEQLPAAAKRAIYTRMWEVLSGADRAPKYSRLSPADRDQILEILQETKQDLLTSPRPSQP